MTYDDWKLESPEDEHEREIGPLERRARRREWLEENVDYLRDRDIDDRITGHAPAGG